MSNALIFGLIALAAFFTELFTHHMVSLWFILPGLATGAFSYFWPMGLGTATILFFALTFVELAVFYTPVTNLYKKITSRKKNSREE